MLFYYFVHKNPPPPPIKKSFLFLVIGQIRNQCGYAIFFFFAIFFFANQSKYAKLVYMRLLEPDQISPYTKYGG